MKTFIFPLFVLAFSAQANTTCTITGPDGYNGPASDPRVIAQCGTQTPPTPIDPATPICVDSQLSTSLNGVQLKRQCSGGIAMLPSAAAYNGSLYDLGVVLGNTAFPSYNYAGYSPTLAIRSGYYVSLEFTPGTTGAFQLVADPSYGDGGIISLSTVPGALTPGSTGVICSMGRGSVNSLYIGTSAAICPVRQGTTYYVNFADADYSGNALCYRGSQNTCTSSTIAYTLYTSGQ